MIRKCPQCGERFDILWPHLWRYRIGQKALCSWSCYRAFESEEDDMDQKISREQKDRAIEIALDGGDPKPFLKECGSIAPDKLWYYIKMQLKKKQPEVYEQLAKGRREKTVEEPEKVPTVTLSGPIRIETPETNKVEVVKGPVKPDELYEKFGEDGYKPLPKITAPLKYDDFTVQAIKGDYGRYSRSSCSGTDYLDFTSNNGEELSMPISAWRDFLEELNRAAKVLGVEL